jgi:hypothetical protein
MGGGSSARPENLGTFVTRANAVTNDLQTWVARLTAALNSFQASGSMGTVESGAIQAVPGLLQNQRLNATFVDVVCEAFLNAGGQAVHPMTGQTVAKSDPMWHWRWS